MKRLIISLSALFFYVSVYSQSNEDYESTLKLVSKAFNDKKASLIHQKFSPSLKSNLSEKSFEKTIDSLHNEKGNISSYQLILEDVKEKNYLVEFENGSMLIRIFLSPKSEILMFKIKDY